MTEANGSDRIFTRVEAAAFLTDLGHKISPQRLATRAAEGLGPSYEKNGRGRSVAYKESVLRAWVDSPDSTFKGGRGKKAQRAKPRELQAVMDKVGRSRGGKPLIQEPIDLRAVLKEHVALADRFFDGDADVMAAVKFVRSLETLRRLVAS